jgi:fatty acyl-CoA reductase
MSPSLDFAANGDKDNLMGRNVNPEEINAELKYSAEHESAEPKSEIVEFLTGRNVFITGGTGFLGRVLIYKLLKYVPEIGNIYLLIRAKKGVPHEQRLTEMREHFMFATIAKNMPGQLEKLRVVQGDIIELRLGMSDADRATLVREISVVFHSAATVKFDEELSKAVSMNVRGTKEMLDLAKEMPQLASFVHVSTCYCHCNRETEIIEEKVYPPEKISVADVLRMCENKESVNTVESTKKVIGDRPNTYTFTKAIAEQVINEERGVLPIAIVRPSIVVGAMQEPVKGWIDNMNGPAGIVVCAGHGILRSLCSSPYLIADMIPVDTVINLMCAVAWKTFIQNKQGPLDEIPVYNCNSGQEKPVTWKEMSWYGAKYALIYPMENTMLPPGGTNHSSEINNLIWRFFVHFYFRSIGWS